MKPHPPNVSRKTHTKRSTTTTIVKPALWTAATMAAAMILLNLVATPLEASPSSAISSGSSGSSSSRQRADRRREEPELLQAAASARDEELRTTAAPPPQAGAFEALEKAGDGDGDDVDDDAELSRTMSRSAASSVKSFNELIDFDAISNHRNHRTDDRSNKNNKNNDNDNGKQAARRGPSSADDVGIWPAQEQHLGGHSLDDDSKLEFGGQAEQSERLESRYVNGSSLGVTPSEPNSPQEFGNQTSAAVEAGNPSGAGAAASTPVVGQAAAAAPPPITSQNKTQEAEVKTQGVQANRKKSNNRRYRPQIVLTRGHDASQQQQQHKMVSYTPDSSVHHQHHQTPKQSIQSTFVYDPIAAQSLLIRLAKTFDQHQHHQQQQLRLPSNGHQQPRRLLIPVAQFQQLMNPIRAPQLRQPSSSSSSGRFSLMNHQDLITQTSNNLYDSTRDQRRRQRGPFHLDQLAAGKAHKPTSESQAHDGDDDDSNFVVASNQETVHSTGPSPSIAPADLSSLEGDSAYHLDQLDQLDGDDSDPSDGDTNELDNETPNGAEAPLSSTSSSSASGHRESSSTISIVQRTKQNESLTSNNNNNNNNNNNGSSLANQAGDRPGSLGQELLVGPFKSEAEAPATITLAGVVYQKSGSSSRAQLVVPQGSRAGGAAAAAKDPPPAAQSKQTQQIHPSGRDFLVGNKSSPSSSSSSSSTMATGGNTLAPLIVQGPQLAFSQQPTAATTTTTTIKSMSSGGNILLGSIGAAEGAASGYQVPASIAADQLALGQLPATTATTAGLYSTGPSSFLSSLGLAGLTSGPQAYFMPDDSILFTRQPPAVGQQEAALASAAAAARPHATATTTTAGTVWLPNAGRQRGLRQQEQLEQLIASSSAASSAATTSGGGGGASGASVDLANQLAGEPSNQHYSGKHGAAKEAKHQHHHQQPPIVIVQKDVKPVKYHLLRAYLKLRRLLRPFEATYVFPSDSSGFSLRRLLSDTRGGH